MLVEPLKSVVDYLEAALDREELGDVVDDEICASLEDPRRGEEAWPGLHVVESLSLLRHEEPLGAPDLLKVRATQGTLDDAVDEGESNGVVFHLQGVEVVE